MNSLAPGRHLHLYCVLKSEKRVSHAFVSSFQTSSVRRFFTLRLCPLWYRISYRNPDVRMASSGDIAGVASEIPFSRVLNNDLDSRRLEGDDVIAGGVLFLLGVLGLLLYGVVCTTMARMCEIVGFRFILSQAIADIFLLIQFAIWPGLVILTKSEITPPVFRWYIHIYLDATWWSMVYHYPILAWSRLAAVQHPNWFRLLSPTKSFFICSAAWTIGIVQSLVEHQFSWFEPLYYDPTTYGLTADWSAYGKGGTYTYYMFFNVSSMILPFPFYGYALFLLFNRHRKQPLMELAKARSSLTPSLVIVQRQLSIESRLLLPCVINTLIFVFGQIVITLCSKYHGKWIGWLVMVLFTMNSLVNPILYITFSTVIRRHIFTSCRKRLSSSAIYREYDSRSSSQTSGFQQLLRHYSMPRSQQLRKKKHKMTPERTSFS
uniref:G_PROTEIN_RECEP_F1_2 domain-containing protein n=1 Tax=Steinernema glaseri TaxID=37863 RepID=A0A1I7XZQ5_9BILA